MMKQGLNGVLQSFIIYFLFFSLSINLPIEDLKKFFLLRPNYYKLTHRPHNSYADVLNSEPLER